MFRSVVAEVWTATWAEVFRLPRHSRLGSLNTAHSWRLHQISWIVHIIWKLSCDTRSDFPHLNIVFLRIHCLWPLVKLLQQNWDCPIPCFYFILRQKHFKLWSWLIGYLFDHLLILEIVLDGIWNVTHRRNGRKSFNKCFRLLVFHPLESFCLFWQRLFQLFYPFILLFYLVFKSHVLISENHELIKDIGNVFFCRRSCVLL